MLFLLFDGLNRAWCLIQNQVDYAESFDYYSGYCIGNVWKNNFEHQQNQQEGQGRGNRFDHIFASSGKKIYNKYFFPEFYLIKQ